MILTLITAVGGEMTFTTLMTLSIENLTSSYGLTQLISEPTYLFPTSDLYIDPIFMTNKKQILEGHFKIKSKDVKFD